jgi:hypothetical protein
MHAKELKKLETIGDKNDEDKNLRKDSARLDTAKGKTLPTRKTGSPTTQRGKTIKMDKTLKYFVLCCVVLRLSYIMIFGMRVRG